MLKTASPMTEKKIKDKVNRAGTNNFLFSSLEFISSYINRNAIRIKVPMRVLDPIIIPVDDDIVEDAIVEDAIDDIMLDNISILPSEISELLDVDASLFLMDIFLYSSHKTKNLLLYTIFYSIKKGSFSFIKENVLPRQREVAIGQKEIN